MIYPSIFSKSSMALALVLGALIYRELILVYSVRQGFNFILLSVAVPLCQHRWLQRSFFPH